MAAWDYLRSFLAMPAGIFASVCDRPWHRRIRSLSTAGLPGVGALLLVIGYGLSRRFEAGLPLLRHVRPQAAVEMSLMVAVVVLTSWLVAVWYNLALTMFGDRPPALLGLLFPGLTRRLGMRSIVTLHEQPIDRLDRLGAPDGRSRRVGLRLVTRLLLESDVVCVTTRRHLRALETRRDHGSAELVHLPLCGYDEPSLAPLPAAPTALILTSYAPHKNLPLLVDAFGRVRRRLLDARLMVAGIDHPRFPGYLARLRGQYRDALGVDWIGEISDKVAPSPTARRTSSRSDSSSDSAPRPRSPPPPDPGDATVPALSSALPRRASWQAPATARTIPLS